MKDYKRAGIFDSNYSLYLYLLTSTKEEIENTYFFFSNGIPEQVRYYFKDQSYYFPRIRRNSVLEELISLKLRFTRFMKWPFLKNAEFWGMRGLWPELMGNHQTFHQVEDGYEFLGLSKLSHTRKFFRIRQLLHGKWYDNSETNYPLIEYMRLTKEPTFPLAAGCVVDVINQNEYWERNRYGREILLASHGIDQAMIERLKKVQYILLIQTFAEDHFMSLEDELVLYDHLIEGLDPACVMVKPHPRAYMDKKSHFNKCMYLDLKCPMQLLALCGVKPKKILTIYSTSVKLPYKGVEVQMAGTCVHPGLVKKFGYHEPASFIL